MIVINQGMGVMSIHRLIGDRVRYVVHKAYINNYDSIDVDNNNIYIVVNDNVSYYIVVNVSGDVYVDNLLKQSIRQEKIEEVLS